MDDKMLGTAGLVRRILIIIFLVSFLGGAGGFFVLLRERALAIAADEARLMLTAALAVSDDTDANVFPLLDELPSHHFDDQVVPFHLVQAVFCGVQARYRPTAFASR